MYSICLVLSGFMKETYAEYIPGTKCPKAPDKSLDSICGVVKSAKPTPVVKDGVVSYEAPKGIPGVSVYVYECDNQSPSCKLNGDLVRPFSSTSTNKDGMFYLWARKLDNYEETGGGPSTQRNVMSKKRYLVFSCGKTLAGMQEIPSYLDLTYVIQEVDCGPIQAYVAPKNVMSVLPNEDSIPNQLLANQMGTDDMEKDCTDMLARGDLDNYAVLCDPMNKDKYRNHLTAQFSFKPEQSIQAKNGLFPISNYTTLVSMNVDLKLQNADPRFMHGDAGGFMTLANIAGTGSMEIFPEGPFWSRDCIIKYPNDKEFCMTPGAQNVDEATDPTRSGRIADYTSDLYTNSDFVIQNKLPNIPPKNSLRFYKEFPARQDIMEFIQDPTDPAKFLSLQFSNCIGSVFLRKDNEIAKDKYVACSKLQKCNEVVSRQNSYLNIQTTGGPAKLLASPNTFRDEYLANVPMGIEGARVCKINPENDAEEAIRVGQIQPPWEDFDPSVHKLDSSYWSPELIYYFGKNNVAAKYGFTFQSNNDSFIASGSPVNEKPFTAGEEAASQPVRGGFFAMYTSGGKRPNNTMAGAVAISSNKVTKDSSNALTSLLSPPTKDGLYELKILSGIIVPTLGSKTMRVGEFSKVNDFPEEITIEPEDDQEIISNRLFGGNLDHHPLIDQGWDINGLFNGTRTPTSAIYLTDPAINRIKALATLNKSAYDIYDSFLSTIYGKGTIDFSFSSWPAFISAIVSSVNPSKSFLDRVNADTTLPLTGAEARNDLQTEFTLSEENFTSKFPLPTPDNLDVTAWGGKGGNVDCYEWHIIPIAIYPIDIEEETCNTDKTESPDEISRTCRVDICKATKIDCTCEREAHSGITTFILTCNKRNPYAGSDPTECSVPDKLICAQNQFSCIGETSGGSGEKNCLSNTYGGEIDAAVSKASCDADKFAGKPSETTIVPFTITVPNAPACMVSRAGPYTCGGTLEKDSELVTKTGTLPDNPRTVVPPQNADSVAIANNELRKSFQSPFEARFTYGPAAFESGDSSIRTVGDNNIAKRKGTLGIGGDTQNGAITRGMFSAPLLTEDPVYNKVNLHCSIEDNTNTGAFVSNLQSAEQMGSFQTGNWACMVNDPPIPEVVDLKEYFTRFPVKPACKFNPSDTCVYDVFSLVFGPSTPIPEDVKFSPAFVNILNAAASRINIPASVLMSLISGVGKQTKYGYYFTTEGEKDLEDASYPWYGSFPGCDEMNSAAVGPYDLILQWFNGGVKVIKGPLDELAVGRHKTAARCNFLDSTFVTAAMLKSVVGASNCENWTWEDARQALLKFAWGFELQGQPEGNTLFSVDNDERNTKLIFEHCKY